MRGHDPRSIRIRIALVSALYLGLFGVMIMRGYQLQLFKGEELSRLADRQITKKITLPPVRGKILDRNGTELATNREVISVYAQPHNVSEPERAALLLAGVLGEERGALRKKMAVKTSFVWLKRSLPLEREGAVARLNLKGVGIVRETRRYYPNMELAGQLIGFAGIDSQGLEGVERRYNDFIKGTPGYFLAERDALGRNIYPAGMNVRDASSGDDVVLTIDRTLQHITERELGDAVEAHKAKGGMALVMDPHTGEVLAMAVKPAFNPNLFERYTPADWRNRVLTDTFEPGSTFKIFLAAAALDSGKVRPGDMLSCENGRLRIFDHVIHDVKPHGRLSVEDIIKVSSNIGAYKIAEKTGRADFYRYIRSFGFGEKTELGLPGESSGALRPQENLAPIDFANLAFGQGISVTAVQLLNALSVVANGGHLMKPHVVKKIVDSEGRTVLSNYPVSLKRVITEKSAREVTAMLKGVISQEGTGGQASLEGYQVAGKTGTSQIFDAGTGSYSKDRFVSSFVGFLPADDPKLSILVLLEEPQEGHYGGEVAAPAFRKIAEQSLAYLKVSPARKKEAPGGFRWAGALPEGGGENRPRPVVARGESSQMPDLTGLTLREMLVSMGAAPQELHGRGVVVEQKPLPGEYFAREKGYRVRLEERPLSYASLR